MDQSKPGTILCFFLQGNVPDSHSELDWELLEARKCCKRFDSTNFFQSYIVQKVSAQYLTQLTNLRLS
jgi:hypothetical protein